MTSMTKFVDANIFLKQIIDPKVKEFVSNLNPEDYCTSVLVLTEVHHKLTKKGLEAFKLVREIMSVVSVLDITQSDFFLALTSNLEININDKIHIATMKRNNISTIISFDKDFDKEKTIAREEP